jgi:cytochrome c553
MRNRFIAAAACGIFLANLAQAGLLQTGAFAATQLERGSYLVNTIMACGNCHSPKGRTGQANTRQSSFRRINVHTADFCRDRFEYNL